MEPKGYITRITSGDSSIEAANNYNAYTDNFSVVASGKSSFTADGQTIFGSPKKSIDFEYFIKGYWTDKKGQITTKAHVGNQVTFNVETKNIPDGDEINIMLFDYHYFYADSSINIMDSLNTKTIQTIRVHGNKASISINIGTGVETFIDEDWENKMRLYVECRYKGETNDLPLGLDNYLSVSKIPFPLKIHQRSFAPWPKFGSMFGLKKNSFYGDNRGFSLADNLISDKIDFDNFFATNPTAEQRKIFLESRNKKNTLNNQVTSRIYQMIYFDYQHEGVLDVVSCCNMTRGNVEFINTGSFADKIDVQSPDHEEYYGTHGLIPESQERNVVNIQMEASDPLIHPAPNIRWKVLARLNLVRKNNKKYLEIDGSLIGKGFPAEEVFIEDSKKKRIFLYTYQAINEEKIGPELSSPLPDFIRDIKMSIQIEEDDDGFFFGEIIYNGLFEYSDLNINNNILQDLIGGSYFYNKTYENIKVDDWNKMHLLKPISKDI